MSQYRALADYLAEKKADHWEASFEEVEARLGFSLPKSAYRYPAWWANQSGPGHSQTNGWRSVGWRTSKLDLERHRVRFERERPASPTPDAGAQSSLAEPTNLSDLIARAMVVSGIKDQEAVLAAALREFIAQEAIRCVIELGGSQPDFEAAPRRRPWA